MPSCESNRKTLEIPEEISRNQIILIPRQCKDANGVIAERRRLGILIRIASSPLQIKWK